MERQNHTKFIATTAIFIALLVTLQSVTKPLGQYITGSMVNMVLIMATLCVSLASGIVVALLSPIFAFLLGIGPAFIQIVPFIMAGNLVLVIAWGLMCKKETTFKTMSLSLVVGAIIKFLTLYFGIIKLAIPFFLNLNEKQTAVISASFSYPQLVTACIGGVLAILIAPTVRKAIHK